MTSSNVAVTEARADLPARRDLGLALRRGFLGRCPNCGKGAMFRAFVAVDPHCAACGEDLSRQRADDAPIYLTLLIVCHVAGAGVLMSSDWALPAPVTALLWLSVTAILCLMILTRMKGAVVGFQGALRTEGFAGRDDERGTARV